MLVFSAVGNAVGKAFGKVKTLAQKAWHLATLARVNDEILAFALKWIRVANHKFIDNGERREFVVQLLLNRKVPESVARLCVEMAFQIYKKEVSDKIN